MRNKINLSIVYVDAHLFEIEFYISNEINFTSGSFYQGKDSPELKDFASKLISFPINIDDKVSFEIGKIENNSNDLGYLLLDIQCYEQTGQASIHVKTSNNQPPPFSSFVEFYIRTDPASINRLGAMIHNLNIEVGQEIIWEI